MLTLNFVSVSVTIKELKSFVSRINCKMNTARLMEHFNEIDGRNRGELGFDDFSRLYFKLLTNSMVGLAKKRSRPNFDYILNCSDCKRLCGWPLFAYGRPPNGALARFPSVFVERTKGLNGS